MDWIYATVSGRTYRCEVAQSDEDRRKGLSGRKSLPPDEGMLFDFTDMPRDSVPQMYMKDTTVQLDMIGIDRGGTVVKTITPKPESTDLIDFPNCAYVLEVNAGSGISPGDDFEMDESDLGNYVMKILAPDGTAQGFLVGGERIFSRVSTRMLVSRAKKAFMHRDDREQYEKDCLKLGKYVFKELYAQDHREPQYVQAPLKKE